MNNNLYPGMVIVSKYLKNKERFLSNNRLVNMYGHTKGITVKEGMDVLGTTEIRKIMSDFRKSGYRVVDCWECGQNRFGQETRYKRYFLKGKIKNDK